MIRYRVVSIVDEMIERGDALFKNVRRDPVPLFCGNDAG